MRGIRILLAGGSTGGHIYPLIAVSQELQKIAANSGMQADIRYFGAAAEFSHAIEGSGIRYVSVISSKLRRYFSLLNVLDIGKFFIGFIQALWKLFWFMPDVAFSKGGPGVLPMIYACVFYRIPIVIHESDSVPGLSNRLAAKYACRIFIGFASAIDAFSGKNVELAGNPIRPDLAAAQNRVSPEESAQVKRSLGFSDTEPLLLILGGSQGMARINDFILENLRPMLKDFQILHQVGDRNYDGYAKEYAFLSKDWSDLEKNRYQFKAYFDEDLIPALRAADAVLARAGATTIFELACFGKPAILVPLPEAANDHQRRNAYQYAKTGGAVVIEQENFLSNLVLEKIREIVHDKARLAAMGEAGRSFYKPAASQLIAEGIAAEI